MRFAVISDIHFAAWPYGSTLIDGFNSRLLDQKSVFFQFIDYIKENNIPYALICGDIFDKPKVPAEVLMVVHECFEELAKHCEVYCLVGNHEQERRDGSIHALSILSPYAYIIDWPVSNEIAPGVVLAGCPYTEDKDLLDTFMSITEDASIVLMHQGVSGVELNAKGFTLNESLTQDMISPNMGITFTGHYHSAKRVKINLIIPGSPMQLTWGDKNESRGWWDYNLETGELKHVESKAPKFVDISDTESDWLQTEVLGNFIRITSSVSRDVREYHEVLPGAKSIEVVYAKPEAKFERIERFDTFTGLFEEFVREKALSVDYVAVGRKLIK